MSRKKEPGKKTAARITIESPGLMTKSGRKDIVVWLRKQADWLNRYGDQYTDGRFTSRFIYTGK